MSVSVDTLVWVERRVKGTTVPEGREGHALVAVNETIVVFGGRSESSTLSDTHILQTGGQGLTVRLIVLFTKSWVLLVPQI